MRSGGGALAVTLRIAIARHARAEGNAEGRMLGRTDAPLDATGRAQAAALGAHLRSLGWIPTGIYSSPLRRARDTAAAVRAAVAPETPGLAPELAIALDDDLQELHGGIFENLTWAEARSRTPDLCDRLEASRDWLPVPGAESPAAARSRAGRFVARLLAAGRPGDRWLVVTHGGLLPHLLAELLGCDRTWQVPAPPSAWFELALDRDRWAIARAIGDDPHQTRYNPQLWRLCRFADTSHLI